MSLEFFLTVLLGDKINNKNCGFLVQLVQKSIKILFKNPVFMGYRRKIMKLGIARSRCFKYISTK